MRLAEAYLDCTGLPDAEADVASVAAWIGLIETIARIPADSLRRRVRAPSGLHAHGDRGALVSVDEDQCAVIRASSAQLPHLDDVLVSVATLLYDLGSIGANSVSELRTAFSVRTYDPSHDIVSLPHGRCGMCGEDVPRFYAMAPGIVRSQPASRRYAHARHRARSWRSCSAVDGAEAGTLGRQAHAAGREVSDEEVRVRSAGPSDSVKKRKKSGKKWKKSTLFLLK